jgi:hypothetical protein
VVLIEEIDRLIQVFSSVEVPEMTTLLNSLRQYCMGDTTFDETDFRRIIEGVLHTTPNMTRLKLNLPFQVIGRASRTATLILATMFACFAQRPEEYKPLRTLVLEHVSDSTILDICRNPIDLGNTLKIFKSLKNLVISIKRQESTTIQMNLFADRLWLLITEARNLESLCISGWNVKPSGSNRRRRPRVDFNEWMMKSLPYPNLDGGRTMKYLRCLELKRIDIDPVALTKMIEQHASSLKELYLNEVYLKVLEFQDKTPTALWIGLGKEEAKLPGCFWLAQCFRQIESLDLQVLRVKGLGYNDFDPSRDDKVDGYDLVDPLGLNRSFEQRFVEAVLGQESSPQTAEIAHLTHSDKEEPYDSSPVLTNGTYKSQNGLQYKKSTGRLRKIDYDVETYQRHYNNSTSHWKCSIDGLFINHNEKALIELQKIISVADRGMTLMSEEIDRLHALPRIPEASSG